ncbi:Uma2 family endonuclease [Paractinoplanes rishiriensis]|uniref:Putative restriction endonuclease domain-containing protein n=1 Tax=Paractinoplanes rishiriensis TaxID=1050105 RepID=A0A919JYH6_9ACTN|nr:Uma2 family endonuclease [Actinoplanes rishiriensis]GIE97230.1 hypothetical protein Ari01nite_46950 [Actinoplanes rishiriensis]
MTFDIPLPWTAAEYLKLGETAGRVELLAGSLWFGPRPGDIHQDITCNLLGTLRAPARAAGFRALRGAKLRLGPECVALPDLVAGRCDRRAESVAPDEVILVGEVASPETAMVDRCLKRDLYADAGIAWYLLIEPSLPDHTAITVRLLRLAGDHYVKDKVAELGEVLKTDGPFPFQLHAEDLLDF